ncbi:MAG TPA: alpha/beta hydrolase-fold protein [Candidatus Polarisedimenticolaceae bacterium]|nr:alpha/beta hydrolase-fold protein [Candidatus Polarisedimenticolaceae bacterium]
MPVHNFAEPRGQLERVRVPSRALAGNLLGDPATRTVAVYLPEEYARGDADYPLFVALAGFGGSGLRLAGWQEFGESLPQRLDRLVAAGRMGPVIAALPDGFTSLGGNQYVDSIALGRWEEFLLEELLPLLESRYRVRPGARAIFGKSSGGYGALVQALRHGEQWGAVACHSGDMAFELCYRPDFPKALDALARHGSDVGRFLEHVRGALKLRPDERAALMALAMGASYDPDPAAASGARLPVDPHTCELDPQRWERWLAHDPLRLVERADCQASLHRLKALYLDCGSRDQFALHYGARALAGRLGALGIAHRYEEFDDDHGGIEYRLDVSLPLLYAALA